MMNPDPREKKLPKWTRETLRDLRRENGALQDEIVVLQNRPLEDPISRPGCRVEAMMMRPSEYGPVLLPTSTVRFTTPNGVAEVRVPIFDHERGVRVSMDGMVVQPEVSNVITIFNGRP